MTPAETGGRLKDLCNHRSGEQARTVNKIRAVSRVFGKPVQKSRRFGGAEGAGRMGHPPTTSFRSSVAQHVTLFGGIHLRVRAETTSVRRRARGSNKGGRLRFWPWRRLSLSLRDAAGSRGDRRFPPSFASRR